MEVDQTKKCKGLENTLLDKLVADPWLSEALLKEIIKGKFKASLGKIL
jgi:hypothetical protein